MARIRVDTEELRKSAKEIAASADAVGKAGDEILAVAASLPSYEGQLSGPAHKAGYEIQSRMRDLKTALAGDSDLLYKAAQDFEAVDGQAVGAIGENQSSLACALSGIKGEHKGSEYPHPPFTRMVAGSDISYEYMPETKTIIIVYRGKFYEIPYDPNNPGVPPEPYRGIIEKIIHNCDDVEAALTNLDGDLLLAGIGLLPFVGDIAMAFGIVWQSLRNQSLDLWDLGIGFISKGIEKVLEGFGKDNAAKFVSPVLGTVASIPTIKDDFDALADAYNEAPSLEDIHKLCNPDNGVVISVKDDLVDHNGFSPAPVPQDPQTTLTPQAPDKGASTPSGATATPSATPEPVQTPTQTQTSTPTTTPGNPDTLQSPTQPTTPSPTPSGTPTSPYQTTTPDPTLQPTQTPTPNGEIQ
jgi:uncharacterized protein YukE